MYGYQNSNDLAPGKSGGKFGLNTGAFVTKFEYNPNGGSDGAEADAIDVTVQVGEREYMRRFFPVNKVFREGRDKDGNRLEGEITDTTSDEYKEAHSRDVKRLTGILSDIVKCFVSEEALGQALATPMSSFKDYAQTLERLVKSNPDWSKTPVDVFLQYQWSPKGDNNRTYLEFIPKIKTITYGQFICKSLGAGFAKDDSYEGVRYRNAEGTIHPFVRNKWYATSAFANQATLEDTSTADTAMNSNTAEAAW